MATRNLTMPGNPRYQPKALVPYFGYDNLYSYYVRVEIATMEVLHELGIITAADFDQLTTTIRQAMLEIVTTDVDRHEREVTKHDIRALVDLCKEKLPPELARWVHIPLTSYDVIDTGRALMYLEAYRNVIRPSIRQAIASLAEVANQQVEQLQIGRTHGQHALPITTGFWLATVLQRWMYNYQMMDECANRLVGKISGAVGASNAVMGLGFEELCTDGISFEDRVLYKLRLEAAPISTQILPPEPLAYFLFSAVMLSASIAQFGLDCRNLMRTEIGEVAEPFSARQSGSSTMAHKRNPITFESLQGALSKQVSELMNLLMTLLSDHQRDLTGSSPQRDFPIILINLQTQLETLCRQADGRTFIERIRFFPEAMKRNFGLQANVILAEPLYIALQMAGYTGDAHDLVNHKLVPEALDNDESIIQALEREARIDDALRSAWDNVLPEVRLLLSSPQVYTGKAVEKTLVIVTAARELLLLN